MLDHAVRSGDESLDAGAEEKSRLGTEAGNIQARGNGRLGDPGKVNPGGDVLHTDIDVGIIVRALFEVAAERASGALRMIIVRARQTVIEQQDEPALEALAEAGDPRLDTEAHLGGVARREGLRKFAEQCLAGARELSIRSGGALDKFIAVERDT